MAIGGISSNVSRVAAEGTETVVEPADTSGAALVAGAVSGAAAAATQTQTTTVGADVAKVIIQAATTGFEDRATGLGRIDQGPTGEVKQGDTTYTLTNGRVSLNGKDIGVCDDNGDFKVTIDGNVVKGNVGAMIGTTFEGDLSTGKHVTNEMREATIELGGNEYTVRQGDVFSGKTRIGTMEDDGTFNVKLDGKPVQGNIHQIAGAVINGKTSNGAEFDNRANGDVHVGTSDFHIEKGIVYEKGERVGTIGDDGRYDVTLKGKHLTGNVEDVHGVVFKGTKADGTKVEHHGPTGNVDAKQLGLGSLQYGSYGDFRHQPGTPKPSGHVEVYGGEVYHQGVDKAGKGFSIRIGTMNDEGEFNIQVDGRTYSGVYKGAFLQF